MTDNFDDGVLASSWTKLSGTTQIVEGNGVITMTSDATVPFVVMRRNDGPYSLLGSSIYFQVPSVPTGPGSGYYAFAPTTATDSIPDSFGFSITATSAAVFIVLSSVLTVSTTWTPTAGMWCRLSEAAGTVTFATATSAAGPWTTRQTTTQSPAWLSSGTLLVQARDAGTTATLDNLNFTPVGGPTPATFNGTALITSGISTGDGANAWGGHQCRMVRSSAGVFTFWVGDTGDINNKTWHIVGKFGAGAWSELTSGNSKKDPGNLLVNQSTGRIYMQDWERTGYQRPVVFHGIPSGGALSMTYEDPGAAFNATYQVFASYQAAAIGPDGSIYVQVGFGTDGASEQFYLWRRSPTGVWKFVGHAGQNYVPASLIAKNVPGTDFGRYNYAHILPKPDNLGVWVIATRNDNFSALGYTAPAVPGQTNFPYAYDKVGLFHCADVTAASPTWTGLSIAQETPSATGRFFNCGAHMDGGFLDSAGRVHVTYVKQGASTGDILHMRHAVVSPAGAILDDTLIWNTGVSSQDGSAGAQDTWKERFARVVANAADQLYIITAVHGSGNLTIYPVPDPSAAAVGTPQTLAVGGFLTYPGLMGTDRRAGHYTPSNRYEYGHSNAFDGSNWRYEDITLPTFTTGVQAASAISDNFDNNVIDPPWVTTLAAEASGKLVGTANGTTAPTILRNEQISIDTLASGIIYWQMPDIVGTACWGIGTSNWPTDRLEFVGLYPLGGGTWRFSQISGGSFVGTFVDTTLTPGMWARLAMTSGTVFLDTSTDGITWNFVGSITPPAGSANYLTGGYLGATTIAATNGDKVSFDNLNTPPSVPVVTTPSVLIAEQVTNTARVNSNNGDNSWGGNQNRVVTISNGTTADGTYCIYQISDGQPSADGLGGRTWQLKKRTGTNTWTTIATGPQAGVEWACPSLVCDQATGRLWILTWVNTTNYSNYTNGRIRTWTGIPNGTTFNPVDDPTSSPAALYGVNSVYMSGCLLPNQAVFVGEGFGAGAATDANEYWTRTASAVWTHSVKDVSTAGPDGKGTRWGYPHHLPDRQGGNGVWTVGNRDGTYADYGYTQPTYNGNSVMLAPVPYIYSQVNAWHTVDGSATTPIWTEHNILWTPQQNTGTAQATQPYCGSTSAGSWVDKEGRLHVLTQYTPQRDTSQITGIAGSGTGTTANPVPAVADKIKHTVLSTTGTLLSQADVPGLSPGYCVFLENVAGSLFILGSLGGTATATLFAVPNRASAATGTTWTLNLGGNVEYSGIHEAGLRAGNQITNTPEVGFVSTGYNTYRYAKIQLPTG